jgi:hypothetical protein
MRLLIGIMLLLLIVGIAASVQSGNSTGKSISNQTNISISTRSVLGANGINRSAMAAPSKATFETSPVSSPGNAAAPLGEGMAMETPGQASFDSYVV